MDFTKQKILLRKMMLKIKVELAKEYRKSELDGIVLGKWFRVHSISVDETVTLITSEGIQIPDIPIQFVIV